MKSPNATDYFILTFLALLWASAFFNIKIATYSYGPITIAFLRIFFGMIPLLLLCYFKKILNEKDVSMAHPNDVKKITGYTIGGVYPVGHLTNVKIYIDTNLERFTTVFAAAGHPNCVFKINFSQLITLTNGEIKEITE